jgi:hypothetical protein
VVGENNGAYPCLLFKMIKNTRRTISAGRTASLPFCDLNPS